jgi:hypothetical protein
MLCFRLLVRFSTLKSLLKNILKISLFFYSTVELLLQGYRKIITKNGKDL